MLEKETYYDVWQLQFKEIYLQALKGAILDRLSGKWDGKSIWNGWNISGVEEIIKRYGWDKW
jgi:hypothetical protein